MTDGLQVRPALWIRAVTRVPTTGPEDRVDFEPGVNVLVGVPNTGKSKWLRMIDYVLGDDNKPDNAFGSDLASKYESCLANLVVAGEEWIVERRWKEDGLATKICVNGEWMTLHSYWQKLMRAPQIPVLHYPQGNPYGTRAWPELGWRSLFRHMYRRQLYWSDLADRQPESEQHACLLQFVGLAETIFSDQYAQLVALEKKIQTMQNAREQFVAMLQDVSRELIDEKELGIALTPDSISAAIERHAADIERLQRQREVALASLLEKSTSPRSSAGESPQREGLMESLGRDLGRARQAEEESASAARKTAVRIAELRSHRALIAEELARMQRALDAGGLLADLKLTHCPACDRPVDSSDSADEAQKCYVCQRPYDERGGSFGADKRLQFELKQLASEMKETDQLLGVLSQEAHELDVTHRKASEEIVRLESALRPVRVAAAFVLPPELTILDQETGRLQERVAQLRRIRATLDKRESISSDIERIQGEVADLEVQLVEQSKKVSSELASDLLTDGMNTYLNIVNEVRPQSWTQPPVDFIVRSRGFEIRVGRGNWRSKLGGTLTLFFLMAYHFALLRLTQMANCHYPGLCVLDFPAQLDGVAVSDSENFVLEPFVRLMRAIPTQMQLIAAGSSFARLDNAHRIELTKVWRDAN